MGKLMQQRRGWLGCLLAFLCLLALPGAFTAAEPSVVVTVTQSGDAFMVDATVEVHASANIAWNVMTDFDHMADILTNLHSSKVSSRVGNTWTIRQEGALKFGFLSFSFQSEREVRLEPIKRILAKSISGPAKRMESESNIIPQGQGAQIKYHSEVEPDSWLGRMFGAPFIRHEVAEQFKLLAKEMLRRQAALPPPSAISVAP